MVIKLHSQATTPPKIRAAIQASDDPAWVLAERHGTTEQTVWKWCQRASVEDRSHTPHRLQTTLTPAQEAVAVALRKTLLVSLDDLLAVVREFLNPKASRSGLDRCLRRHGVGPLRALERACPMRIRPILPDNGKEFTDRLFGLRQRAATGAHECDTLGAALDIDHRLTLPRSPQTNGMVERFNGRIEEVLQSHPFRSGEDLEATLLRYVWLYTQPLPQSALGSKTPLQAMKGWRKPKPALVRKQPYYLPGCES